MIDSSHALAFARRPLFGHGMVEAGCALEACLGLQVDFEI